MRYVDNEAFPTPQIGYELTADGKAKQILNPAALAPTLDDTDSGWLNKGYITYTLLTARGTPAVYRSVQSAVRSVNARPARPPDPERRRAERKKLDWLKNGGEGARSEEEVINTALTILFFNI
nr:5'-nucleotidase [Raoultella sp. NCTC 9187]